jgi:hypothetical protein
MDRPHAIIGVKVRQIVIVLQSAGFHLPTAFAVATLDWHADDAAFAGIYQDHSRCASEAAHLVIANISRNITGLMDRGVTLMVDGAWRKAGPVSAPQGFVRRQVRFLRLMS